MKEEEKESYDGPASLSPIPLHVGSAPIQATDKGKIKALAYEAMTHHANQQVDLLRRQAELLMQQVREIEDRVAISRRIYEAEMRFTPEVGLVYHLYAKDEQWILSLIGPNEWGRSRKFDTYIASVRLLADRTWEVMEKAAEI